MSREIKCDRCEKQMDNAPYMYWAETPLYELADPSCRLSITVQLNGSSGGLLQGCSPAADVCIDCARDLFRKHFESMLLALVAR